MNKKNKIIYWIATVWLSLGMTSSAIVQLMRMPEEEEMFIRLGFPLYLLPFLAVLKIMGVVAVLVPGFALLKEWAYAGFVFFCTGAVYAHAAAGHPAGDIAPAVLLLFLTIVSLYFRPASRKLLAVRS